MTKKKGSKDTKVSLVSPEIPAISLPPPTNNNGSTGVNNNQNNNSSDSSEKDRLKSKLFKKKSPSSPSPENSNGNGTFLIERTSELKSSPAGSEMETNTKNVAESNTKNSSATDTKNSSETNAKNSLEANSVLEFSKFQETLTQIIQGRENPTRWKEDLRSASSTSEIRIDIDVDENDEEVEEILGLDLEHENRKSSPNGHQKYQMYSSSHYQHHHQQQLGSTGSSPNSIIISPTSTSSRVLSSGGGGVTTSWDSIQLCSIQSCSKWASFKCKSCKNVSYCSEEHQKADWKRHKDSCIPYEWTSQGGKRLIVAARNIAAGQLIFSQKPLFVFPIAAGMPPDLLHVMDLGCVINENYLMTCEAKRPACFGCMKSQESLRHRCSKCGLPLCSPQCEYEISHQFGECSVICSSSSHLTPDDLSTRCLHSLYMDVEILRSLHLRTTENCSDWEALLDLSNHSRVLTYKKSLRFKVFQEHLSRLVPLSAKASGNDLDLISDLHAIVTSLSFRPGLESSYKMLIPTQLEFGHDCIPNTIQYIENEATGRTSKIRCVVKAAVSIIKDEMINLDFLPTPYLSYTLRRKVLENLSINCSCRRCTNPSDLGDRSGDIKCPNCDRGFVHPENPILWKDSVWSCSRCQEEVPYAQITQIHKDWSSKLYNIPKSRAGLEKLVDFCKKAELRLNGNHELVIMAWCFIESIIRKDLEESRRHQFPDAYQDLNGKVLEDYRLLRQYCEVCDGHFKALRPGLWLDRGIMLLQRFFAHLAIASLAYQSNGLNRKDYANKVIGYMKDLQEATTILAAYDGYSSTPSVQRITQDTTWALSKTKEFIEKFLKCDPFPTRSISYPLPI